MASCCKKCLLLQPPSPHTSSSLLPFLWSVEQMTRLWLFSCTTRRESTSPAHKTWEESQGRSTLNCRLLRYLVYRGDLEVERVLIPSHVILLVRSVKLFAVFLTTHHPTHNQQRGNHDRFDVLHKRLRLLQLVEIEVKSPIHYFQGKRVVVTVVLYQILLKPEQSSLVLRLSFTALSRDTRCRI